MVFYVGFDQSVLIYSNFSKSIQYFRCIIKAVNLQYKTKQNFILIVLNLNSKQVVQIQNRMSLSSSSISSKSIMMQSSRLKRSSLKKSSITKYDLISSFQQLQRIYKQLSNNNNTLKNDISILKSKLKQIQQKKKSTQLQTIPQNNQVKIVRNELDKQYQLMNYLKMEVDKIKNNQSIQIKTQKQNLNNQIKQINQQIQLLTQKRKQLFQQGAKMSQSVEKITQIPNQHQNVKILYENQTLKKKITSYKQQHANLQLKSIQAMNIIYKQKQKLTYSTQLAINRSKSTRIKKQQTSIMSPTKSTLISSIHPLQQIVTSQQLLNLKSQIQSITLQNIKQKSLTINKSSQLKQQIKHDNIQLKLLQQKKTKKNSQLNHLRTKLKNINNKKIQRQRLKYHIIHQHIQVDQWIDMHDPLRRDFAGILGNKLRFDDRIFLRQKKKTFIKGLIIYQNQSNLSIKHSLAGIRAIYTSLQVNVQNSLPIPSSYLQKCRCQILSLPEDDFIKLIKVKYSLNQTRVLKLQIRTNKNNKYQFGQKRTFQDIMPNQTVYAMDIGMEQVPVSLFGSFIITKNCWYIESIGVQINTLI